MRKLEWMSLGVAALLVAGCNKAADQANVAADNGLSGNESAAIDNGANVADEAPPVAVAAVPAPAADVPPAEAAPLRQAAQTATEIVSAPDVERIPYQGGWAWRRNGQILRTASSDGRVSYFRPGDSNPYLVQQGGRAFAYANGHVERSYDQHGRPAQPDAKQRDEGQRLAQQSTRERDQAKQVAQQQPQRVQHERPQQGGDHKRGGANGAPSGGQSHDSHDHGNGGQASQHRDRTSNDASNSNAGAPDRKDRSRDRNGRGDQG